MLSFSNRYNHELKCIHSDATVQSLTLPKPSAQYNHERALKNWSKLKSILKMSMFAFGNAKGSIKYKLKKIAQEGKLKEVVTLTETTLKEKQEKKRIDKTYKLYKSIKNQTKFVRLLNYEDEISQLQDISHENSFQVSIFKTAEQILDLQFYS